MEVEGSWSGNDTIWRTCLDLNRVLLYGRPDASMAQTRQRRVVNIVDALIAGHGNGPLSPEPIPMGLLLGSTSSAAMDWVGAMLLGYAPERIPITRGAFEDFPFALTSFRSDDVTVLGDIGNGAAHQVLTNSANWTVPQLRYPIGWLDAVVLKSATAATSEFSTHEPSA